MSRWQNMSSATDTFVSNLLFVRKIGTSVDFYHSVSIGHGGVVWAWNLLGCVQPFQCQHPGTHQSLGWTFPRPRPAGCLFHARNGRPRPQSGWVQPQCGSDQSEPPGMFYCWVGASKTNQLQHRVILISEINYVCVQHSCSCVNEMQHISGNPQQNVWPTISTSSFLLASPMLLRAMSTSFWPGRQFTQLFSECDTALAT